MTKDPSAVIGNPFSQRSVVEVGVVAVMDARRDDRNMVLIEPLTRAVRQGEIHEFIMTDEVNAQPGSTVNRVTYLAFGVIRREGIIRTGDDLIVAGEIVGQIAGYDETHMPNHMNIVFYAEKAKTGAEINLTLGQEFTVGNQKTTHHDVR